MPEKQLRPQADSPLLWENRTPTVLRGYLVDREHTTLFLIDLLPDGRGRLSGAFIPDAAEGEVLDLETAKAKAEQYLLGWVHDVGSPILGVNPTSTAEEEFNRLLTCLNSEHWSCGEKNVHYGFFLHGWYGRANEAAYQAETAASGQSALPKSPKPADQE